MCLQVREVRVARDRENAATGTVTLVRRDPLAGVASVPWPHRDAAELSLWEPIPVGVDELGATVTVALPERNVLLGGEPGAGKSAALSLLVATAALDPARARVAARRQARGAVGVGSVRAAARGPGHRRGDRAAARAARRDGAALSRAARARSAQGRREDGLPLHLVACDELAFYLGHEDRKKQKEFAELLRDLVARGRAAGVIVCAATQKPAADVVPSALRDLFGFRLALRCNTPQASDTILGQGWASLGHNAATIAPAQRGVGLLLAEDGLPVRMRGFHLGDADVDELAARAAALRTDEWLSSEGGAVMSARRKVPDEVLAERVSGRR